MYCSASVAVVVFCTAAFSSCPGAIELEGFVKHQDIYHQELTDTDHHALLSRFLIRRHWQISASSSLLLEGISAYDSSHDNQRYSVEHNTADINRLLFNMTFSQTHISLGRHVWSVGNQRLLGGREGTNVRRRFDGVQLEQQLGRDHTLSLYHGYSVKSQARVLDDTKDRDLSASGFIFRQPQLLLHGMHYTDNRGQQKDDIYSVETEYQLTASTYSAFIHLIYQFGDSHSQKVSAWFGQIEWRYKIARHDLALTTSYASGGGADDTLQTQARRNHEFRPLFAKAPYYSDAGIFATTNIWHIGINWRYPVSTNFSIGLDAKKLYRVKQNGAIYGPGQSLLLPANSYSSRALANNFSFTSEYQVSKNISFEFIASYVDINHNTTLRDGRFFETILHYRY